MVALRTFPKIQFERNTSLENGNNQFHRFQTPQSILFGLNGPGFDQSSLLFIYFLYIHLFIVFYFFKRGFSLRQ